MVSVGGAHTGEEGERGDGSYLVAESNHLLGSWHLCIEWWWFVVGYCSNENERCLDDALWLG